MSATGRVLVLLALLITVGHAVPLAEVPVPEIVSLSYPGSASGGDTAGAVQGSIGMINGSNFALNEKSYPGAAGRYQAQAGIQFQQMKILFPSYPVSESRLYFSLPLGIPCGDYPLFVVNANLASSGESTLPSNPLVLKIACGPGGGSAEPMRPQITRITPDEARPGEQVSVIGRNFSFPMSAGKYPFVTISGLDVPAQWISINQVRFTIPADAPCGDLQPVQVTNLASTFTRGVLSPGGDINIPEEIEISSTQVPLLVRCSGRQPPAPPLGANGLAALDRDQNCRLSDGEFFAAVDRWVAESISSQVFFQAVDLWISQGSLCSEASRAKALKPGVTLRLTERVGIWMLHAQTANSDIIRIELYAASGERILSQSQQSGREKSLAIRLADRSGRPLSNGVYWVRVTTATADGQAQSQEWRRIYIIK